MNALMTLLMAVLNSVWQAAVLAAVVWLGLRFAARVNASINAATRFAIWWAVLGVVVILPVVPWVVDAVREGLQPATIKAARPEYAPPAVPFMEIEPLVIIEPRGEKRWPLWVAGAWGLLFAYRLGQLMRSYVYLRGVKRRASVSSGLLPPMEGWGKGGKPRERGRAVRLLLSDEIDSPIAVGFARPAVILPESLPGELSRDEMDHVLLHESAHLARWDDWTKLLARILGAGLALHPVAWWVLRRIEIERELTCDDWVVARTRSTKPYARSLARLYELRLFRRQESLLASGMFGGGSGLVERIEGLLARRREFTARVSGARVGVSCAGLLALAAVASFSPRWIVFAQAPRPVFDVASIKRHVDVEGEVGADFAARPGGTLHVRNNPISNLIQNSYGIAHYQLVAPDWVKSETYDMEAKGAATADRKEIMLMVQSVLADRFAMKAHFETREMQAYILTVAKGGSKLKILSPQDCVVVDRTKPGADAAANRCGNNLISRNGVWRVTHDSMPGLTGALASILRGPVIDRTGIKGTFDFELRWTDDLALPDNPDGAPGITTAVRETLGLDVKSGRGPVEVLVVDHIERPSVN